MFPKLFKRVFICALLCALPITCSHASSYLVGASITLANSAGAQVLPGIRYTTNSADPLAATLGIDMIGDSPDSGVVDQDISFALATGSNVFTVARPAAALSPTHLSLNLFFNGTGTPFAPTLSDPLVGGDLVAVSPNFTGNLFTPNAGVLVADFNTDANIPVPYSGATSFMVGTDEISISQFDVSHPFGGTLTSTFAVTVVSTVPIPPALWLFGTGLLGMIGMSRRKKPV